MIQLCVISKECYFRMQSIGQVIYIRQQYRRGPSFRCPAGTQTSWLSPSSLWWESHLLQELKSHRGLHLSHLVWTFSSRMPFLFQKRLRKASCVASSVWNMKRRKGCCFCRGQGRGTLFHAWSRDDSDPCWWRMRCFCRDVGNVYQTRQKHLFRENERHPAGKRS